MLTFFKWFWRKESKDPKFCEMLNFGAVRKCAYLVDMHMNKPYNISMCVQRPASIHPSTSPHIYIFIFSHTQYFDVPDTGQNNLHNRSLLTAMTLKYSQNSRKLATDPLATDPSATSPSAGNADPNRLEPAFPR